MPDQSSDEMAAEKPLPEQDWLLEALVRYAESGIQHGVTLFVGGAVISGEIISPVEYLEIMAVMSEGATYSGAVGTERPTDALAQGYRDFKKIYQKPDVAGDEWTPPRRAYIHLQNARVFTSNGAIPGRGSFLWRGLISSVDAWSLGAMST